MPDAKLSTVVVADADRNSADAVGALLAGAGLSAEVAYGGRAAIALCNRHDPACVVLDIAMPDVSGLDVARYLRARHRYDVHIVGYTSQTSADDHRRARTAGFDEVIAKDVDPFDLLTALGATTRALVMRSLDASRRQLRLQLDLANALLGQAWLMPDIVVAEKSIAIVVRTLGAVDSALARLPFEPTERIALAATVARLRNRLLDAGAG